MSASGNVIDAIATILAEHLLSVGGRIDDVPALMRQAEIRLRLKMERASLDSTTVTGGSMILLRLADIARPNTDFQCDGGEGEFLTCQVPDCGMKLKMLKRHLLKAHKGMTPTIYRQRYNLPDDAPMVTKAYSEVRTRLAKKHGLGTRHHGQRGKHRTSQAAPRKEGAKKRT